MRLPKGYVGIRHNKTSAFALPTALDWTESVLSSESTLYEWARQNSTGCARGGRADPVPVLRRRELRDGRVLPD